MGNLIIQNNNITKVYECKTTHTGQPYLQINKNNYLDLTTNTTSGLHLEVKLCTNTNNLTGTTTEARTSQESYNVTTGYAGYSYITETMKTTTAYSGYSQNIISSKYSEYIHQKHDQTLSFAIETKSISTTRSNYSNTTTTTSTGQATASKYSLAKETIKTVSTYSHSNIQPYFSAKLATGTGRFYLETTSYDDYYSTTSTGYKSTTSTYSLATSYHWTTRRNSVSTSYNATVKTASLSHFTGTYFVSIKNYATEDYYQLSPLYLTKFDMNIDFKQSSISVVNFSPKDDLAVTASSNYSYRYGYFIGQMNLTYDSIVYNTTKTTQTISIFNTTISTTSANNFTYSGAITTSTQTSHAEYTTRTNINNLYSTTALIEERTSIKNYTTTDYVYDIYRPKVIDTVTYTRSSRYTSTSGYSGYATMSTTYTSVSNYPIRTDTVRDSMEWVGTTRTISRHSEIKGIFTGTSTSMQFSTSKVNTGAVNRVQYTTTLTPIQTLSGFLPQTTYSSTSARDFPLLQTQSISFSQVCRSTRYMGGGYALVNSSDKNINNIMTASNIFTHRVSQTGTVSIAINNDAQTASIMYQLKTTNMYVNTALRSLVNVYANYYISRFSGSWYCTETYRNSSRSSYLTTEVNPRFTLSTTALTYTSSRSSSYTTLDEV